MSDNPLSLGVPYQNPANPLGGARTYTQPRTGGALSPTTADIQERLQRWIGSSPLGQFAATPRVSGTPDEPEGENDTVSTRIPWNKAAEETVKPHKRNDLRIGIDAVRDSPAVHANNAMDMKDVGDFPDLPVKGLRNPDAIANRAIDHMADNLVFLHNHMVNRFGQDMVDRASMWYDGANALAKQWAQVYRKSPRQVAAVMANMSPQKDWFQNVGLAGRMLNIVKNQQGTQTTPEMSKWLDDYAGRIGAKIEKDRGKLDEAEAGGADVTKKREALQRREDALDDLRMSAAGMRGRTLGEINNPDTRAVWVRAFDEAHHPRDYHVVTPEGQFSDLALTDRGKPQKIAWGSFKEIGKALQALEGPDNLEDISRSLGGNHKVRSFYNNIIAPDSRNGHVTIDTHAIAAAHMRPLSGKDYPVELGLGLKGSADSATGAKGSYGIYHEAYQRAAARLSDEYRRRTGRALLPRQLQSITWEGIRGLFGAEDKRNVPFYNENHELWRLAREGRMTPEQARQTVITHGGDIDSPAWWPHGALPGPQTQ